jgi:hypothetical protein
MNEKIRTIRIVATHRIRETLLSPAFYVLLSAALAFIWFSFTNFCQAIDSDGLNLTRSPFLEQISKFVNGFFGKYATEGLFARGPFLFTFTIVFFPFVLYLGATTSYKLGNEKSTGACQLIIFGPVNLTPYYLSFLVRDAVVTLGCLVLVYAAFLAGSLTVNMIMDITFYSTLAVSLFFALAMLAYAILASTLATNGFSALSIYLGSVLVFLILYLGSLMSVSEYSVNAGTVIAGFLQVVSPFFYWQMSLGAIEHGNWLLFLFSILVLAAITAGLVVLSHFLSRTRSVKV